MDNGLGRFVEAQKGDYEVARAEVFKGRKRSHWMWYIFPQLDGLGVSHMARYYAIKDIDEAIAYLGDPVLGDRLVDICNVLKMHCGKSATAIFGNVDALKLRSSLTLFSMIPNANPIFDELIASFFNGEKCPFTVRRSTER